MADVQKPVPVTSNVPVLDEDTVFKIFSEGVRRNLLTALARKGLQTAAVLHPVRYPHQLHNVVSHLGVMRDIGLVTMTTNPNDGRRALYSLSSALAPIVSEPRIGFVFSFPTFQFEVSFVASPAKAAWNENVIFPLLADSVRRRLLLALAKGGPQLAVNLQGAAERTLDVTLKRLVSMRDSGLVTMQENPKDRRRALYALTPKVPLKTTESGKVIDFGYCVLRLGRGRGTVVTC